MLTADLVDARRSKGELILRTLDDEGKAEALAIATALLDEAHALVGERRGEVDDAWDAVTAEAKRPKLAAGLKKLTADACNFEASSEIDPAALRRTLFLAAAAARKAGTFDRARLLSEVGDPAQVERTLFSDLKSEHVLQEPPSVTAAALVDAWELGQAQAVLLTAVRVTCEIGSSSAGLVRALFKKLKFHQLLFAAQRTDDGWKITIDGPYSMFDAVTKYGLRLALVLSALRPLERWSLTADIRWGKQREPLVFRLASSSSSEQTQSREEPHLADEVRELIDGISAHKSAWTAKAADAILDVPGLGVCIPDLALTKKGSPEIVYVEVMGYWSRDAVWKRIELAESGALGAKVIFAVSSRLRVSAEALDTEAPASLYVYKGKMSARSVVALADRLTLGK